MEELQKSYQELNDQLSRMDSNVVLQEAERGNVGLHFNLVLKLFLNCLNAVDCKGVNAREGGTRNRLVYFIFIIFFYSRHAEPFSLK